MKTALFTLILMFMQQKEAQASKMVKAQYQQAHLIYAVSEEAFKSFQKEGLYQPQINLDFLFLKMEKKQNFSHLSQSEILHLDFNLLTNKVIVFINKLNSAYKISLNPSLRKQMQFEFYGLSQAIKKSNSLTLTVDSDHFDKLHDMLMGQGISLLYVSLKDKTRNDLFFTSYYLNELKYPMDLTAKHLQSLLKKTKSDFNVYAAKMAMASLTEGNQINKLTSIQLEVLYQAAQLGKLKDNEVQQLQKLYLKQLNLMGDQEKIKAVKKELAASILKQESKNLLSHPLNIFKYIQFCIGYMFIAWPLEFILVLFSILILAIQSTSVLTAEEKHKTSFGKKIWLMFTKAYLGNNVPFFSKVAASLVLFGIGLYFNSAKNFVELMIANL